MKKKVKSFLKLLLVLALIGVLVFYLSKFKVKENEKIKAENIEEQIVKLAELSSVKYNYTDVLAYENSKQVNGMDLPFTKKKFIVKYSGYIKVGHDLDDLDIKIDEAGKRLDFRIPEAKILDNVIIEEEVAFFDEKNGVFNKLNYEDLYDVLIKEKKAKEKEAKSKGIMEEADKNLKDLLKILFKDLGYDEINIY